MTEVWIPIRFVREEVRCWFCHARIPKASPGSTTGTRGTKAWWDKATNRWECLPCHDEGTRAQIARDELDDLKRGTGATP
jgi:hypothetical protein